VLTDDETTQLQFAIDAGDAEQVRRLVAPLTPQELTELQLYGNSTAFMYACERSTPEVVQTLLDKNVQPFELPFSDNNEVKSAVRNKGNAAAILHLVLAMLPNDLAFEMITSSWDPDEQPGGDVKSAFQLAEKLEDPACKTLLLEKLDQLKPH
jgi:hypothetical protein